MTTLRIALGTMLAATSWTFCGWAEEHNKVAYTEPEKAGIVQTWNNVVMIQ